MALRVAKKDVKKSSYYVWFLGAQEARTATGAKHALAALARLEARAAASVNNPSPPTKVTLQVSGRGLKIIQNVAGRTVKHLLPADSVTEVRTKGDAVVCVLLLYNPATRCPLHAHAYRCDSDQTAQALCHQLRSIAGLGPEDEPEPEVIEEIASDIDSRGSDRFNENHNNEIKTTHLEKRTQRRVEDRIESRDKVDSRDNRIDSRDNRIDSRDNRIDSRDNRVDSRDNRFDSREKVNSKDRVESREMRIHSREKRVDSRERTDVRDSRERDIRHAANHDSRIPPVEMRLAPEQEVVAERLAAELRTRLAGREPLLLPPRDYDTNRRGPTAAPQATPGKRIHRPGIVGSSAGSSGIGSDLAPSPERPHTSSEEDWNDSTAYMLHEGYDVSVSPRRGRSPSPTKHHARTSVSPKDRFNNAKEKFLNLEREKINDEIEKRIQMRKNLNMALSRGPLLPSEIKKERRSNNWDDDDDGLMERRGDFPRRNDPRDLRRNDFREERPDPRGREVRDFRDSRYGREVHERDYRNQRDSRALRDPMDLRDLREQRPIKEDRDDRGYRDYRDAREYRDYKEPIDGRDRYNARNADRNGNEYRDSRENVISSNHKESRDYKYGRDYHDDVIEEPTPRRSSKEKTPQLEQRYFEYKGERNDKFFENRYSKHESRSDDEGVESEKQFEEIRYVPHVELPRRRDVDLKGAKAESKKEPTRDGRIELLEERQRQIESGRLRVPPVVDPRLERNNMDPPVTRARDGEWDVIRRSYADAERQRRDPRMRHSYAEPVARTRVGMATVAPF